jgi:hypothetical protein
MRVATYRSRKEGDKVLGEYACRHVAEGGVHFALYILYLSYFDLTYHMRLVNTILLFYRLEHSSMTANKPGWLKIIREASDQRPEIRA